jgi:hypothetical protein
MDIAGLSYKLLGFVGEKIASKFWDDALPEILRALGDNHYDTAIEALQLRKYSQNPSREVTIAISHLLATRNALVKAWEKYSNSWLIIWTKRTSASEAEDWKKMCEVACLLATSYHFLEEKTLAIKFMDEALECFGRYKFLSEKNDNDAYLPAYRTSEETFRQIAGRNREGERNLYELKALISSSHAR